jgi:hypothetical protein
MAKQLKVDPEVARATNAEISRQISALETKKRVTLDELLAIARAI